MVGLQKKSKKSMKLIKFYLMNSNEKNMMLNVLLVVHLILLKIKAMIHKIIVKVVNNNNTGNSNNNNSGNNNNKIFIIEISIDNKLIIKIDKVLVEILLKNFLINKIMEIIIKNKKSIRFIKIDMEGLIIKKLIQKRKQIIINMINMKINMKTNMKIHMNIKKICNRMNSF